MDKHDRKDLDLENPIGISHQPVPTDDRIRASNDPASVRRRRKRALGEDVEESSPVGGADDPEGATGIDMGAGGDGHGIKHSR